MSKVRPHASSHEPFNPNDSINLVKLPTGWEWVSRMMGCSEWIMEVCAVCLAANCWRPFTRCLTGWQAGYKVLMRISDFIYAAYLKG